MKVSFNPATATLVELYALKGIINNSIAALEDDGVSGPGEEDGPWAEGYAERISTLPPGVPNGPVTNAVVNMVTDKVISILTTSDTSAAVIPPPPPSGVVELPEQPVVVPTSDGLALVVSPEAAPPSTVTPPPAPAAQVPPQVPTGTNEGLNAMLIAMSKGESVGLVSLDELDSDGKPWDATVHSESRAKNVDGIWRKRRVTKNVEVKQSIPGLEAITPNSVPAPPSTARKMVTTMVRINGAQNVIKAPEGATDEELSVITGQPTVREGGPRLMPDQADRFTGETVQSQVPAAPTVSNVATNVANTATVVPPPPPAAPAAPAVIKTAPQGSPVGTFKELIERVSKYFGEQVITSQDVAVICATYDIPSIQHCFAKPELVPQIGAALDAFVASRVPA